MRMPYQCMTRCGDILIAARGSSIDSFRFQDGSLLSTWKCPPIQDGQDSEAPNAVVEITSKLDSQNSESSFEIALDAASPPAKKRKVSKSEEILPQAEGKNGKKKQQGNRASALASRLEAPAVVILASTTDGRHVIAVTGEDKSVRVFENVVKDGAQQLKQLSLRAMPKRPCALVIANDNSTIISADKFGDVYALPLIPPENYVKSQPQTPEPSKLFVPAANELTIHSQRNRRALENQKKHTNKVSEKTELTFEHKLLLGHVSLLTDLILVTSEKRNYIITADRDEHIRISRGIPQTHIIEGFCLGHAEFVSRLCIPRNRTNILVSAGGDDDIFVWDWKAGRLISRTNLTIHVETLKAKSGGRGPVEGTAESLRVAVSGIYHTRAHVDDYLLDFIIITCEGIPALFSFNLHLDKNILQDPQILELPGNPLAVITDIPLLSRGSTGGIIVSIDTVHQPGSITEIRSETSEAEKRLMVFHFWNVGLIPSDAAYKEPAEGGENLVQSGEGIGQLSNLLYNLENLRKRDGDGPDE